MSEWKRVAAPRITRRQFGAGALGLGLAGAGFEARVSANDPATPVGSSSRYLFAADPSEAAIYVYSLETLELTGQLDDVVFGGHGGLLTLPDGRLIFSDDRGELLAAAIDDAGAIEIVQRTAITAGETVAWMAFDPGFRFAAAPSLIADTHDQVVNLVDLETFTNTELHVTTVADEEVHAWLIGDPLHLHVALGGQVDSYLVSDLLAGDVSPVGSVQVELGSHGGVTDVARDRIALVSLPGFEVLDTSGGGAVYQTNLPWDVGDLTGGRNARPRLAWDGDQIIGVLTKPVESPELWADAEVSVHIANLADDTVSRTLVGNGRFAGRIGVGEEVALLAGYGAEGGAAYVYNIDTADPAYGTVTATIPLELPGVSGEPGSELPSDVQGYFTAVTHDGTVGAILYGGDGRVDILDLTNGVVAATIELPTAMRLFPAYISVVEPGLTPVDLWGR